MTRVLATDWLESSPALRVLPMPDKPPILPQRGERLRRLFNRGPFRRWRDEPVETVGVIGDLDALGARVRLIAGTRGATTVVVSEARGRTIPAPDDGPAWRASLHQSYCYVAFVGGR